MKPGDKIVCINRGNFRTYRGQCKDAVYNIYDNKNYTIANTDQTMGIKFREVSDTFYHRERFITIKEYRALKIKKIKSKINE